MYSQVREKEVKERIIGDNTRLLEHANGIIFILQYLKQIMANEKSSTASAILLLIIRLLKVLLYNKSQSTAEGFNLECFAFIQFPGQDFFTEHIDYFFLDEAL